MVVAGELGDRGVKGVEAGEWSELETVAHARQFTLERRDRLGVELFPPVEGRGAVVGEELPRKPLVDRLREISGLVEVGSRGLAPQQVRIRRVGQTARDGGGEPALHAAVSF